MQKTDKLLFNREFLVEEQGRGGSYNAELSNILMADKDNIYIEDDYQEYNCLYTFLTESEIGDKYELNDIIYTRCK